MNTSTMLHSLKHLYRGKVRDSYEVDDDHILMVVSDRISAFDVVFDDPIPNKGKILQALTDFWFQKIGGGQCRDQEPYRAVPHGRYFPLRMDGTQPF